MVLKLKHFYVIFRDISKKEDTDKLAKFSAGFGHIKSLIHTAGVSPTMTNYKNIIDINALGTVNVDQ